MDKSEIQNLIRELIGKTTVAIKEFSITEESPEKVWISVEVSEPHFFIERDGEGLQALNHLAHRIVESKILKNNHETKPSLSILVDINNFQKKHIENIRAIAHMMSERARYFKSNIEIDPMSPFERRIVHEFLANANDVKTESVGTGRSRRVVIKYLGTI